MPAEINESIELVADTDIEGGYAGNGGGRRVENGCVQILIECIVAVGLLIEIEDVEAVASAGAHFHAIEFDGIVGVDIEI